MKKFLLTGLIALVFSTALIAIYHFYAASTPKIGYVESDKLLAEYNQTQIAAKEIERNTTQLRNRFDTLKMEFDKMQQHFTDKLASFSAEERTKQEALMGQKQAELGRYYDSMSEEIKKLDETATQKLLKKIDRVVKKYGKENNYQFILGATQNGNIVYAENATNLTNAILQELNKK